MPIRDDETLLRLYAQKGDEAAFRELARRHGGLVYAACLREARRPELAEDAAQAVFLDLARKAGRIRVGTSLVPWLYAAARLAGRKAVRAERRRPTVPLSETVLAPPEPTSDDALFQALDALSRPEREAVVLRFVQGLSLAEVGRAQGVSEDAARMRVQRALKRLRTEYVPILAAPTSLTVRLAALVLPKPSPIMTTPLLLAAGGIASLVVIGAASARSFGLPSHAVAPNPLPRPQPKSQAAVAPKPLAKVAPTPAFPSLNKPFTLVYRLTIRNLRTKAMNEAEVARLRKDYSEWVDRDQITPAEMDRRLADLKAHLEGPPDTGEITLSYDGRTLLYDERPNGGLQPNPNVSIFDGRFTYLFSPGSQTASNGSRLSGTAQFNTWHMPYVGPALPFFPLMRGSDVLGLLNFDDKPFYSSMGRIGRGRGGTLGRIDFFFNDTATTEIVLSDWVSFRDTFVARSVVVTQREFGNAAFKGKPYEKREYALVSATPAATAAARFDPNTYVEDGDDFFVGPNQNKDTRVRVDRSKGTLQEQIAAHGEGR